MRVCEQSLELQAFLLLAGLENLLHLSTDTHTVRLIVGSDVCVGGECEGLPV